MLDPSEYQIVNSLVTEARPVAHQATATTTRGHANTASVKEKSIEKKWILESTDAFELPRIKQVIFHLR